MKITYFNKEIKGGLFMNSKAHFFISLLKSAIRIGTAIYTLKTNNINIMVIGWVIAELCGIFEEIFDKR